MELSPPAGVAMDSPSGSNPSAGDPVSGSPATESEPHVSCPLCGQIDAQAEQEWTREERKRLEVYTHGQLDVIRLQREDFLKHRSEVEAALAQRGQDLNRQLRQFAAQVAKLAQRDKEFARREGELARRAANLGPEEQRLTSLERAFTAQQTHLAGQQQEVTTLRATLTLREQAASEREAEITRREAELVTQQERLVQAREDAFKMQAEHEALRLRGSQIRAENEQLQEAAGAARRQLASLEEEYARRAATLVQREEAPPRREPVAWVQEPVAARAAGLSKSGIVRTVPASGSAPGTARPTPASEPSPVPAEAEQGMTRLTTASYAAGGSASGLATAPVEQPVPASPSALGTYRRPGEPSAPASGSALNTARPSVPASGSKPGQGRPSATGTARTEDTRSAPRRRGNPVSIQITNDLRTAESWSAWVVDRSQDGVCVLADEASEIGAMLNLRPTKAGASARWIQVIVRSCTQERGSFKLGCQFQNKLTWDDLQYFG